MKNLFRSVTFFQWTAFSCLWSSNRFSCLFYMLRLCHGQVNNQEIWENILYDLLFHSTFSIHFFKPLLRSHQVYRCIFLCLFAWWRGCAPECLITPRVRERLEQEIEKCDYEKETDGVCGLRSPWSRKRSSFIFFVEQW